MSLTQMRERIRDEIDRAGSVTSASLAKRFKVSRQAIHLHLKELVRQGAVLKLGTSRKTAFYAVNEPHRLKKLVGPAPEFHKTYRIRGLDEESAWGEASRRPFLLDRLDRNARVIGHYAFTEMLNNAIDHSGSERVRVAVEPGPESLSLSITDFGVGVFENIRSKKRLSSEMEAVQDLLKGKQTTAPERHSGEGIFFTSKVARRFVLESHRKKLVVDNRLQDVFLADIRHRKGTRVFVEIPNCPETKLEDIFRQYTNEDFRFEKTKVTVKLFREGSEYVSRSQAKRLLHALQDFAEVLLDFRDVETVGQGFADEIFRVYAQAHPEIKILSIHENENIRFMIHRALAARAQTKVSSKKSRPFRLRKQTFRGEGLAEGVVEGDWSSIREKIYEGRGG